MSAQPGQHIELTVRDYSSRDVVTVSSGGHHSAAAAAAGAGGGVDGGYDEDDHDGDEDAVTSDRKTRSGRFVRTL